MRFKQVNNIVHVYIPGWQSPRRK